MVILIAALAVAGWVIARPEAAETLPEGCREAVTLLCADPAWPGEGAPGGAGPRAGAPEGPPRLVPIAPPAPPVAGAPGVTGAK